MSLLVFSGNDFYPSFCLTGTRLISKPHTLDSTKHVKSFFIASHPREGPGHRERLLPRHALVRDSVRDRAEQDEERSVRVRGGRAQVRNKIIYKLAN